MNVYRRWLEEEIERERGIAYVAEWRAKEEVERAIRERARASDRLGMLINARWAAIRSERDDG